MGRIKQTQIEPPIVVTYDLILDDDGITPTDGESSSEGQGKSSSSPKTPAGTATGPKARASEIVTPQEGGHGSHPPKEKAQENLAAASALIGLISGSR